MTSAPSSSIDLLSFSTAVDEDVLEDLLRVRNIELHFNDRPVWGDIIAAIVAGRRGLAATAAILEKDIAPNQVEVAVYHPEEQAVYVAVEYRLPGCNTSGLSNVGRAEQVIRTGGAPGKVVMAMVGIGTSAKIAKWTHAIDLKKAIWIPYSE